MPDAPDKLDMPVVLDGGIDESPSPDLPPAIDVSPAVDVEPAIDQATLAIDAPAANDTTPAIDSVGPALDVPQASDGPVVDTGTIDSNEYRSPDGRVFTIVPACEMNLASAMSRCPNVYDDGLARVLGVPDASPTSWTGAGHCAEGSLVYVPFSGSTSVYCYYSATSTMLTGSVDSNDTLQQCGQTDTVSATTIHGVKPPCTSITWVARI